MDLTIERVHDDEVVVLVCTGRLGAETTDDLARAVAEELRRGFPAIRLDLAATTFLSSAGIRSLFEIQRSTKSAGGSCFIRRASPVVKKVLDLTRLTPVLMEAVDGGASNSAATTAAATPPTAAVKPAADVTIDGIRLVALEPATAGLRGRLIGSPSDAVAGRAHHGTQIRIERHRCGFGLAALADGQPTATRAGELAAIAGAVFHRPPQPHTAVDYIVPTAELVAEVSLLAGLVWDGIPGGRAGFEPAGDEPCVRLDELFAAMLAQTDAPTIAVVVSGEVHGLVGVELIRPLAEAAAGNTPVSGVRDVTATWLSFSREPVYARHTALIVGVVSREPVEEPLGEFLRVVPGRGFASHCHAVVFPFRPLRRGGLDLAATVTDLAASSPLAVLHLVADPHPVLGSGRSELFRGCAWFAPLTVEREAAP
jgi:anti-anti-sigma factor